MDMKAIRTTAMACSHWRMEASTVHVQGEELLRQRPGRAVGGGIELNGVNQHRKRDPVLHSAAVYLWLSFLESPERSRRK